MNFNIENFKLTMRPEFTFFYVNGTDVTCKMSYYLNVPDAYLELHGPIYGTVVATAHCHEDDVFNLEVGKKVALAKAELVAYKESRRILMSKLQETINTVVGLSEMAERFGDKAENVITHNKEYITRITQ